MHPILRTAANGSRRAIPGIKVDAVKVADNIIAGNGATVIVRSTLINSMNTVEKVSPEIAAALKTIGGYIAKTDNPGAGKTFNRLTERIATHHRYEDGSQLAEIRSCSVHESGSGAHRTRH